LKIGDALKKASQILKKAGIDTPITDSQLILSFLLKKPRWKLITDREENLPEDIQLQYFILIKRRAEGFPVAYITGKKHFFGLEFEVEEGVLVPRPETEILVEEVLKRIPKHKHTHGLEIGIGSGIIAISLLKNRKKLLMTGVDISDKALQISTRNAIKHKVIDRFFIKKSNLFENIPENQKFDFIVSNPPYISEEEFKKLPREVKKEPKEALLAGKEGIEFYEKIVKEGVRFLKSKGFFAFEIGHTQGEKVKKILEKEGFKVKLVKDLQELDRVIIGEKND
jgi:release factor glutamine methyltransferase